MEITFWQLFGQTPFLTAAIQNTIAFLVGYTVLRPLRTLNVFWLVVYIVLMAGLNWFFYGSHYWDFVRDLGPAEMRYFGWVFEFLFVFAVSIIANIACFQFFFRLKGPKEVRVAILVGFTVAQSFIAGFPLFR
jgi:hypothetical protein